MSDDWIILIPTRPDHVPAPHAQEAARALLAGLESILGCQLRRIWRHL